MESKTFRSPLARSVFSNWAGMGVTGIVNFALIPILIRSLGDYQYGIWAVVLSVMDTYGLLDTGMRVTMQRFVAHTSGRNERQSLNEIFVTTMAALLAVSVFLCLVTAVLVWILPNFFHIGEAARPVFRWVTVLVGASMVITLPTRGLSTYLVGLQRFDLCNIVGIVSAVVRAGLFLVVLHFGYGLFGVAAVMLGVTVAAVPAYLWLVRYADPEISYDWRQVSWARARDLAHFSFYTYLSSGGDYVRFFTDDLVTGRVLSVAMITIISPVERIMVYFRHMLGGLASPFTPRFSELEGRGQVAETRELFIRGTRACALLSCFITAMIVLDGKTLLRLWLGERFVAAYPLLLILAVGYVVSLSQLPSQSLMFAKGRHKALGWWTVGEGILNLGLSIYWARRYGLFGVVLGTTVPMLVTAVLIQPWYTLRLVGVSAWQYITRSLARPVLATCVFAAICRGVLPWEFGTNRLTFIELAMGQTMLFALLVYVVGFAPEDRRQMDVWRRSALTRLRLHVASATATLWP